MPWHVSNWCDGRVLGRTLLGGPARRRGTHGLVAQPHALRARVQQTTSHLELPRARVNAAAGCATSATRVSSSFPPRSCRRHSEPLAGVQAQNVASLHREKRTPGPFSRLSDKTLCSIGGSSRTSECGGIAHSCQLARCLELTVAARSEDVYLPQQKGALGRQAQRVSAYSCRGTSFLHRSS
jgi:hypothetical protein